MSGLTVARARSLKALMAQKGISVRELAVASGYHPGSIKNFRSGRRALCDQTWRVLTWTIEQREASTHG